MSGAGGEDESLKSLTAKNRATYESKNPVLVYNYDKSPKGSSQEATQ